MFDRTRIGNQQVVSRGGVAVIFSKTLWTEGVLQQN